MHTKTIPLKTIWDRFYKRQPPPFFNKGYLQYAESGHTLTPKGRYYVCAEKQKKNCSYNEQPILRNGFDEHFLETMKQFQITFEEMTMLLEAFNIERQISAVEFTEEVNQRRDKISEIIEIVKSYQRKGLSISKSDTRQDIEDLKEQFIPLLQIGFTRWIAKQITFTIQCLHDLEKSKPHRASEMLIEKLYLSNDGTIQSLQLEGIGDYLFQFIAERYPGFIKSKMGFGKQLYFPTTEFHFAMTRFRENNFKNAVSYSNFSSQYKLDKMLRGMFKNARKLEPNQFIEFAYLLRDKFWLMEEVLFTPAEYQWGDGRNKSISR